MSVALKTVKKYFPQVETVTDATKGMEIEVTPRDVATSKRYKHKECAMAVACKRAKHMDGVIVSRSIVYLVKGDKAIRYTMPPSVEKEIVSFDRGGGFAPGEYELSRPTPTKRLGAHYGGKSNKRSGNGKPIQRRHKTEGIRSVLGTKQAEADS